MHRLQKGVKNSSRFLKMATVVARQRNTGIEGDIPARLCPSPVASVVERRRRAAACNILAAVVPERYFENGRSSLILSTRIPSIGYGAPRGAGTFNMTSKVWFITGTSKGFGRVWAEAALARGDRVAATARNIQTLAPLVERYSDRIAALTLDVTDKAAVDAAITEAHSRFGQLDVVINNAGYGLFGTIEEVSEAEARAQLETNLFGALWVTQAALPIMRAQLSGHIIQVSSIGGVNAFPTVGLYHASKWGLEGFSQALAAEVALFGIKVTIVEPGGFATEWGGPSAKRATQMPAYDAARAAIAALRGKNVPGDPDATGAAILKVVDAQDPPLRIFLGSGGLPMTRAEYARRIETWEKWNDVSIEAQGDWPAKQAR
jgi:NAD(P)-dependent dehydrogenase (short-subunit alcohol dehydrogenase family)